MQIPAHCQQECHADVVALSACEAETQYEIPRHPQAWQTGRVITKQLVVGAAIVDNLTHPTVVLGARRIKPEVLCGRWEFPGGKVEVGEDAEEALVRELQEELLVTIQLGPELINPAGGHWPISDKYDMRVWVAAIAEGTPSPTDSHDTFAWIAATDVDEYDWLDADLPIVAELVRAVVTR